MALTRIKTDQITDGEVKSADLDTNITLSGDLSVTDITMTGELNGPATFYIDPAPHDPDTDGATNGLVVIRGDLQVDGTTTTVNSTTMDVADLNITLASGAANAAAADGAGLTVDGASATITYDATNDEWDFNKTVNVTSNLIVPTVYGGTSALPTLTLQNTSGNSNHSKILVGNNIASDNGGISFYTAGSSTATERVRISGTTGNVGIGHNSADEALDVKGNFTLRDATGNLAHGMSVFGDTDQYAIFNQESSGDGGLRITTLSDAESATSAFQVNAVATTPSTDGNAAAIRLRAAKKNGTTEQPLGTNEDVLSIGNTGTELVVVKGSGWVGIGTSNPAALLDVSDSANNEPEIRLTTSTAANYLSIARDSATGFYEFKSEENGSAISFHTDPDGNGTQNRLLIDRYGQTQIGLYDLASGYIPYGQLTVRKNVDNDPTEATNVSDFDDATIVLHNQDSAGTGNKAAFIFAHAGSPGVASGIGSSKESGTWKTNLHFYTNNITGGASTGVIQENMRLTADGNLGIGTTAPVNRLHVDSSNGASSWTNTLYRGLHVSDDIGGRVILEDTGGAADAKTFVMVSENGEFRIHAATDDGTGWVQSKAFMIKHATAALHGSQVRHSIRPTLNLDFANSKELDPRITFYRDSIATYYDSKGVLRYVNHNEPRFDHDPDTGESKGLLIEEARQNLQKYSYHMNGGSTPSPNEWDNIRAGVATNMGIAPDRSYQANYFYANSESNTNHYLREYFTGLTAGDIYTYSMYVKKGSIQYCQLEFLSHDGASAYTGSHQYFDLTDGTKDNAGGNVNPIDSTITPAGNDWYRITLTGAVASGHNQLLMVFTLCQTPNDITFVGDYSDGMYVWGAQMEKGSFATSYVPSDTRFTSRSSVATYYDETGILRTAPANSPRYGYKYNGRKWVETGLTLEGSATNLATDSTMSSTTYWSPSATTIIIGDYGLNPDNSQGNTMFVRTNISSGGKHIRQSYTIQQAQSYSISVYAKLPTGGTNAYDFLYLRLYDLTNTTSFQAWFNLSNGTIGTVSSLAYKATIEEVGNGWYRCSVSGQTTTNSNVGTMLYDLFVADQDGVESNSGDDSSGIIMWGAQLESGQTTSSFIYTSNSSASRSADVASSVAYTRKADDAYIDDIQNYDWYSHDSGTLFAEHNVDRDIDGSAWGIVTLENEGSSDNYVGLRYRSSGTSGEVLNNNSISQMSASAISAADLNYFNKGAIAYETNSAAAVGNGGTVSTDSSVTVPNLTRITIGTGYGIGYIGGHIKKIAYYPERLTNAELQALTEND